VASVCLPFLIEGDFFLMFISVVFFFCFCFLQISVVVICLQRFSNGEKNEALCFTEVWQSAEKEIEPDHEYLLQAVVTHLGEYKCSSNCCTWRRTVK
jgi:hypothetical protein